MVKCQYLNCKNNSNGICLFNPTLDESARCKSKVDRWTCQNCANSKSISSDEFRSMFRGNISIGSVNGAITQCCINSRTEKCGICQAWKPKDSNVCLMPADIDYPANTNTSSQ